MNITALDPIRSRLRAQLDSGRELNEATTIRSLIEPVLAAIGWRMDDPEECRGEYRHQTQDNPVDLALFLERTPRLFVEAKQLRSSLEEHKWASQAVGYANAAGVRWAVLTNGKEWRVYNAHAETELQDKLFLSWDMAEDDTTEIGEALSFISRDGMRGAAIDDLWQTKKVDADVKRVLQECLADDTIAKMISRRLPRATIAEIRTALGRTDFSISGARINPYKPTQILGRAAKTRALASEQVAPQLAAIREVAKRQREDGQPCVIGSRKKQASIKDLIAAGLLSPGETLSLKGRPGSDAELLADGQVKFRDEEMSPNVWGCKVTGWTAIQIYVHAMNEAGVLLDDLRK